MGNRLTEKEPEQTDTPYGDIFDQLFPQFLVMGMSPEEYWDGESSLKPAYKKAYEIRMETEQKLADRNNWYLAQYIMNVLQCVPLLVGGLNVKSSTRLPEFPKRPYLETLEMQKKEEAQKKQKEDQTMLAMAMFQAGIEKFNRNLLKRQEEEKAKAVSSGQ